MYWKTRWLLRLHTSKSENLKFWLEKPMSPSLKVLNYNLGLNNVFLEVSYMNRWHKICVWSLFPTCCTLLLDRYFVVIYIASCSEFWKVWKFGKQMESLWSMLTANFRASKILIRILCYIHLQFLQKIHPYLSCVASHKDLYFFSQNFTDIFNRVTIIHKPNI